MKATLEKIENSRAVINVEVDASVVEKALDRAYQKVVRRVNIPGFRKGKAPRSIVERVVGKHVLWDEALDHIVGHAFDHAVASTGIEPIDRPRIEILRMEDGAPLAFKATVDVKPEVELGDYRAVSVPREAVQVTDADVDEHLRRLQERHAKLVPLEDGEVAPGCVVGFRVISGMGEAAGELQWAEIGSGQLREDFEQQVLGARPGEERPVRVAFPADHTDQRVAGQTVAMTVRVEEIKGKELPPLDDAFAHSVANCATLEELRSHIENKLREAAQQVADRLQANRAVEAVVGQARVDLPRAMVERRLEALINRWREDLARYGVSPEAYLARSGQTLEEVRSRLLGQAEAEVKTELVLEAVAKGEGITATDEEVRSRLREAGLPEEVAGIVRQMIVQEKAVERLRELAAANADAAGSAAESPA